MKNIHYDYIVYFLNLDIVFKNLMGFEYMFMKKSKVLKKLDCFLNSLKFPSWYTVYRIYNKGRYEFPLKTPKCLCDLFLCTAAELCPLKDAYFVILMR